MEGFLVDDSKTEVTVLLVARPLGVGQFVHCWIPFHDTFDLPAHYSAYCKTYSLANPKPLIFLGDILIRDQNHILAVQPQNVSSDDQPFSEERCHVPIALQGVEVRDL
jgi:hypothetical protein